MPLSLKEKILSECRGSGVTAKEIVHKLGASAAEVSATILELFREGKLRQSLDEDYDPALPYETLKWKAVEGSRVEELEQPERQFLMALSIPAWADREFRSVIEETGTLELMNAYTQYVRSARRELIMMSPFVDKFALYPLIESLKANPDLEAKILTEPETLSQIIPFFSPYLGRVKAKALGARLRIEGKTKPLGLHMKSVIVDRKVAMVGSFNLTERHLHINLDCAIVIDGGPLVEQLVKIFERLWTIADQI
ncbi:MAG: phospholipase D family protein [Candidatus Methanomethylicaceae archaeon]